MVVLLLRRLKASLYRLSTAFQILSFLPILFTKMTKKSLGMIPLSGGSSVMALGVNLDESKILAEAAQSQRDKLI